MLLQRKIEFEVFCIWSGGAQRGFCRAVDGNAEHSQSQSHADGLNVLQIVVAVLEASAAAKLNDKALTEAACKELIGDAGELQPAQLMAASMALAQLHHFSTDWKNVVSEQVIHRIQAIKHHSMESS